MIRTRPDAIPRAPRPAWAPALASIVALAGSLACGKRGDPLPPLPRTPQTVARLRLAQRGGDLEVSYLTPRTTASGARLPVVEVELLRSEAEGDLEKVGQRQRRRVAPGESVTEREPLPAPGTTIRVAARVWDGRHASVLSPTASLKVQSPPPAPLGFRASLDPRGIVLSWTSPFEVSALPAPAPPSPSPAGAPPTAGRFWVYRREPLADYGQPLSAEPVPTTSFEDTNVLPGQVWCYVARSMHSAEPLVESASSEEACATMKDVFPPAPPTGVAALLAGDAVEVSWSPSPEADLARYHVYRAPAGGEARRVAELPPGETTFRDAAPPRGVACAYRVTAVDRDGNESAPSPPVEARIP